MSKTAQTPSRKNKKASNTTPRLLTREKQQTQPQEPENAKNSISNRVAYIDPDTGEKVFLPREYPEVFQNGFFLEFGKIPFSPEQMKFVIRNTFEINVFLGEWNKLYNKIIDVLDSDDYKFTLKDQDEIEQCLKSVLIRRYCR